MSEQALERVLALHAPTPPSLFDPNAVPDCVGCMAECLYCEGDHPWPCPTVLAARGEVTS